MNILVLAGGLSPERNVSLTSGSLIAAALRRRGHKVLLIDVYEGFEGDVSEPLSLFTSDGNDSFSVSREVPDIELIKAKNNGREELIGPNVLSLCKTADVTFLALHGAMGENGQLQATLDVHNVVYTGSGYAGSLLAMDKEIAKILLEKEGIKVPFGIRVGKNDTPDIDEIYEKVGLPAVVKPTACGSSVGVSLVDTKEELADAIAAAQAFKDDVLIEKRIFGRELTCGIVGGRVLPPVEIIPKQGFYDYENKYQAGATTEICPAPISDEALKKINDATLRGFRALHLSAYARFDYILDDNGEAWCLEANTLPGMTPTSLLPQEAAAVGMSYDELCETLVNLAFEK
ncbi:MAG: D-alanine--D-alanine ligase [Ruminococcaceae bacterium]|nr:D-alanine--D-alanine ligase [Oscillospiraceae bacterium]